MGIRFAIDVDRQVVFSCGYGVLTFAEGLAHVEQLRTDSRFMPYFGQIIDFRHTDGTDMTAAEVRQLASHTVFDPRSRRAFVAPQDVLYGLSRIFAVHREMQGEANLRVARTLDEAAEWVGVDVEVAEAALARLRADTEPRKHENPK